MGVAEVVNDLGWLQRRAARDGSIEILRYHDHGRHLLAVQQARGVGPVGVDERVDVARLGLEYARYVIGVAAVAFLHQGDGLMAEIEGQDIGQQGQRHWRDEGRGDGPRCSPPLPDVMYRQGPGLPQRPARPHDHATTARRNPSHATTPATSAQPISAAKLTGMPSGVTWIPWTAFWRIP